MEQLLWFDDGTPPGNPSDNAGDTPPPTPPNNPPKVDEKELRNQLLRELSKEHGVNLFDAEGLKQFKEFNDSRKTELEKTNEELESYRAKESEWQTEKQKLTAQLKGMELGIAQDSLEDALKLADNDPDKLPEVVKKYPHFRTENGITLGVGRGQTPPPTGKTEVEQYMADNPRIYKTK